MADRKEAARKAVVTRKHRAAGIKAARTRRLRGAGRKAAVTKRRREAARKAVETRRRNLRTSRGAASREGGSSIRGLTIRQPLGGVDSSWAQTIRTPKLGNEVSRATSDPRGGQCGATKRNCDGVKSRQTDFWCLTEVRPYSREDARLLKKNGAGFGWFPGNFSWVLRKPRRIEPIKAKGKLGLIKVSRAVLQRIGKLPS